MNAIALHRPEINLIIGVDLALLLSRGAFADFNELLSNCQPGNWAVW